jgi:hypothetical protein
MLLCTPVILAACTATQEATATIVVSQIQTYANYIDNAVDGLASAVSLKSIISATDLANIQSYAASADAVIQEITAAAKTTIAGLPAGTVTLDTAQSWVSVLQSAFNSIAVLLGNYGVKIPTVVNQVLSAAEVLLPILLAVVKMAPNTVGAPMQTMSVSEAEGRLATKPQL